MATSVPITATVLRWAIDTSGLADSEVAKRAGVAPPRLADWLAGLEEPTLTQFRKLAAAVKRPTATLLLPAPPPDFTPGVEFRSAANGESRPLNRKEQLKLREIARVQRGLRWVARELNDPPAQLPVFDPQTTPASAAQWFRGALRVTASQQIGWATDSEAFKGWRDALENLGVYSMAVPLGADSMKGFSLWDDWCPVVVANTHWNNTARIFTLFHEVAHLLTRTNSMCAADALTVQGGDGFERWCETFAAEFLLPWSDVLRLVPALAHGHVVDLSIAKDVARTFKVSLRATVLKFIDEGIASWDLYRQIPPAADAKGGGGGGSGRQTPQIRLDEYGRRAALMFARGVDHDAIGPDDALSYLTVSDREFNELRHLAAGVLPQV